MRPTLLAGLLCLFAVAILAVGLACSLPPRQHRRGTDERPRPSVPSPIEGRGSADDRGPGLSLRRGGRP